MDGQSQFDALKHLVNTLLARQTMTEHMVMELYINHARSFADSDDVIARLVERLRHARDIIFEGELAATARSACDDFIKDLQSGYASSHRAAER